jgi:hypothetical protein
MIFFTKRICFENYRYIFKDFPINIPHVGMSLEENNNVQQKIYHARAIDIESEQ